MTIPPPAVRRYYSCAVDGTGASTEDARRPSVAAIVAQYGGSWATCYADGGQYVIAASDRRGDGSVAAGMHGALASAGLYLGNTIAEARSAMPPEVAAGMHDARAYT